ncbi:MAG: CopG family antitoxin [Desulfococcaceae bacterium]
MKKNKRESLPEEFKDIEEAAKFWDTHSLADYEDLQRDTEFEVELKSEKNYFAVERELSDNIDKLAHIKGVLPETLVNLWLKEKILESQNSMACA